MAELNRRGFIGLLAAAVAGEVGRRYFDMGAAWQRHDSGLLLSSDCAVDFPLWCQRYVDAAAQALADRIEADCVRRFYDDRELKVGSVVQICVPKRFRHDALVMAMPLPKRLEVVSGWGRIRLDPAMPVRVIIDGEEG